MIATRALLASVALAGLSAVLLAQAPALDVKLGLWENTIVTNMGGVPPIDTSKMSPEQAAQIAAAMKGMMGDNTTTDKSCLKREDLAKDSFMLPSESGMNCTRTLTANSRTAYAADISCTGERAMKGQIAINSTAGGTAFTGTMKMATAGQGRGMNLSMKMSGKYLGADCGAVK